MRNIVIILFIIISHKITAQSIELNWYNDLVKLFQFQLKKKNLLCYSLLEVTGVDGV